MNRIGLIMGCALLVACGGGEFGSPPEQGGKASIDVPSFVIESDDLFVRAQGESLRLLVSSDDPAVARAEASWFCKLQAQQWLCWSDESGCDAAGSYLASDVRVARAQGEAAMRLSGFAMALSPDGKIIFVKVSGADHQDVGLFFVTQIACQLPLEI